MTLTPHAWWWVCRVGNPGPYYERCEYCHLHRFVGGTGPQWVYELSDFLEDFVEPPCTRGRRVEVALINSVRPE